MWTSSCNWSSWINWTTGALEVFGMWYKVALSRVSIALRVDWRLLALLAARRDAVVVVRRLQNCCEVVREHRKTAVSIYLAANF